MTRLYDALARLVVWAVWVPIDRTVCRFANQTDEDH